jgi:hypothetical protein
MAVAVLKLDLAPPSNLWRSNHVMLGWAALALGGLILAGSIGFTWKAYHSAAIAGKLAGSLSGKTRATAEAQSQILSQLRQVDVAKELPRWRLAERIYTERSLPWSRLTSELERSLVKDVRIKSIQRNRSTDMKVQLKLKGEARSREAEAGFVESLQKNPFFEQVILEREGERQGGGVDFDYTLAVASIPPPYQPLPKIAAATRQPAAPSKARAAAAPGAAVPARPAMAAPPVPAASDLPPRQRLLPQYRARPDAQPGQPQPRRNRSFQGSDE